MNKSPLVHSGHWQRTRDRILTIPKTELTEIDVLEGILQLVFTRGDTNEIARRLLHKFHSIVFVAKAKAIDLEMVAGIGKVAAQKIEVLFKSVEFIERAAHNIAYKAPVNVDSGVELVRNNFPKSSKEQLQAFYLDKNNIILGQPIIGEGELDEVGINYQAIVNYAQRYDAVKVIIAHNHPSGNPMPSKEDFLCTSKLYAMLRVAGYRLIDHVIVAEDKFFSFYNTKIIPYISEQYEAMLNPTLNIAKNSA